MSTSVAQYRVLSTTRRHPDMTAVFFSCAVSICVLAGFLELAYRGTTMPKNKGKDYGFHAMNRIAVKSQELSEKHPRHSLSLDRETPQSCRLHLPAVWIFPSLLLVDDDVPCDLGIQMIEGPRGSFSKTFVTEKVGGMQKSGRAVQSVGKGVEGVYLVSLADFAHRKGKRIFDLDLRISMVRCGYLNSIMSSS